MPEKGGDATTLAFPPKVDAAASACFREFKFLLEEKHPFSAPNSAVGNEGLSLSLFLPVFLALRGERWFEGKGGIFFERSRE